LNGIETLLNLAYLYLGSNSAIAPLVGWTAASLTLSKTVLYIAQDYFCGWCTLGHNKLRDLVLIFVIPDGAWVVGPAIVMLILGKDLVNSLKVAHRVQRAADVTGRNGKTKPAGKLL